MIEGRIISNSSSCWVVSVGDLKIKDIELIDKRGFDPNDLFEQEPKVFKELIIKGLTKHPKPDSTYKSEILNENYSTFDEGFVVESWSKNVIKFGGGLGVFKVTFELV